MVYPQHDSLAYTAYEAAQRLRINIQELNARYNWGFNHAKQLIEVFEGKEINKNLLRQMAEHLLEYLTEIGCPEEFLKSFYWPHKGGPFYVEPPPRGPLTVTTRKKKKTSEHEVMHPTTTHKSYPIKDYKPTDIGQRIYHLDFAWRNYEPWQEHEDMGQFKRSEVLARSYDLAVLEDRERSFAAFERRVWEEPCTLEECYRIRLGFVRWQDTYKKYFNQQLFLNYKWQVKVGL